MIKNAHKLIKYRLPDPQSSFRGLRNEDLGRRPALPTRARRAIVNCQRIALMRAKAIQASTKQL
jgi:hypothetical protein